MHRLSLRKMSSCIRGLVTLSHSDCPKLCVVGSGPAGFYCVQGLLKVMPLCSIDIYEKLPVPFGLVRYGVAPDHPDVKNVTNTFTSIAQNDRVSFFGNVTVGRDVSTQELLEAYHAVVVCTGADDDKTLNIPGEHLSNVLSARTFVGWYNGYPDNDEMSINLDVEAAAVIGHGNVALDVARILLTSVDELRKTDIAEDALESLSRSRVKKVSLVGRRGPLHVAFTIKEFREMTKLAGCQGIIQQKDVAGFDTQLIAELPRPRRRLTELMVQHSAAKQSLPRQWELIFWRSPLQFVPDATGKRALRGIQTAINELRGPSDNPSVVATDETEFLECGLTLKSVGYRSRPLDSFIPFDAQRGVIDNVRGRVKGIPGLYCCGWVASGPVGVILSTVDNSFELSRAIAQDIEAGRLNLNQSKIGNAGIVESLSSKGVEVVTFSGWEKIDVEERRRGSRERKPRKKITSIAEMLAIARNH